MQALMGSLGLIPAKRPRGKSTMSPKLRDTILNRDNWTCYYCGRKLEPGLEEIDHRVPRAWGGSDDPNNLVTACRYCNRAKRDLLIERLRVTPERAREDLFRLLEDPENPILERRVNALVSKEAVISSCLPDQGEVAIERLVAVIDIRRRSEKLREAHRKRGERRRASAERWR